MTVVLEVSNLVKRFGGLLATDNASIDVRAGELHAIIGPNGAGKTTLVNQVTGELLPDSGTIKLEGRDITHASAASRVAMGVARTFQIPQLLSEFTAAENVALAIQSREGVLASIFSLLRVDRSATQQAQPFLDMVGLGHRRATLVAELAHGERKQLELAIALSLKPKILLLDEPMAGLGHTESMAMIETLSGLRGQLSILLVEHDMDAVFRLADRISVLVYGKFILCGSAETIRSSEEVRAAYLGEAEDA